MPNRLRSLVSLILLSALSTAAICGTAHAALKSTRAVSMNALTSAIRSGRSTENAKNLCGITRLCGYLPDAASHDVVLLGVVDPDMPALRLDDLVVALRNAWGKYDKIIGRVRYYTDPGCSIDPNPAVIAQLRDFELTQPKTTGLDAMAKRTEKWKTIGRQPQKVRVLGVPFDCRFAKVMVDADYYMKRLVNGSVALGIDGLVSLSDLDIEERRQSLLAGKGCSAGGSMSRFWFSPGDSTYEVRDSATILRSCSVKLLTEAEYLNEHGVIAQMGRPDPCADQFARSFSEKYDQISAQRPIYKELRALFSFVAIARLMKDDCVDRTAAKSLGYLLSSYKVPITPVSRAVNGLTEVRTISETLDTPDGQTVFSLIQSSCGGVSMNVRPRRIKTYTPLPAATASASKPIAAHSSTPALSTSPSVKSTPSSATTTKSTAQSARHKAAPPKGIKQAVLSSRKSPTAMSWDVPVQLD